MRRTIAFLFVVALLVTGFLLKSVSAVTVDDYQARTFTSSKGDTLQYRLFIPRDYDASKKYPVVLFHHGAGGSGNDNRRQFVGPLPREWADPENQKKHRCFIIAPQIPRGDQQNRQDGPSRNVQLKKHIQTIQEILDHLEKEFSIDTDREYVTGQSMGGECTWMSIIERPDRFAAAVPICAGNRHIGVDAAERGRRFAQFPLWIFIGDADNATEATRELVTELKKAGGNPKYTEYPGVGHNSWDKAYREPELIEWLFAQKRTPNWVKLHEAHRHNDMPYRLMKPINFNPDKSYPVIVSLHGAGGRGSDNLKQLRDWNEVLAEEQRRTDYPSYILAPQSQGRWNSTHLQNVKDIIEDLPSVDMNRIYILGHSMGGEGTYRIIQSDSEYFAAAAPSAGSGLTRGEDFIDASVIKDIPIWAFHGDKDKICPIEKDKKVFAEMQKIGGNMKLTTWVGDGHGIAPKMITGSDNGSTQLSSDRCDPEPVFLKWLFAQKLTKEGR